MTKPKLLFDENIGNVVASRLRQAGYDVVSIAEEMRGVEDVAVLRKATQESRIVVTLDRDFGALIFRDSKHHLGVLYMRLRNETAEHIARILLEALTQHGEELQGKFVVVSDYRIRIRK